jgi:protein kinase C-binding protein NELL
VPSPSLSFYPFFLLCIIQGELQELQVLPGPYGYLLQCEHMDSQCPTCGQFLQLQSFIMELQQNLSQLNQKVCFLILQS